MHMNVVTKEHRQSHQIPLEMGLQRGSEGHKPPDMGAGGKTKVLFRDSIHSE